MIRRSILVAVVAVVLSLIVHGLALNFTGNEDQAGTSGDGAPELTDVGGGFEDFAEPITEAIVPEPADAPDPPSVTAPEPVTVETPTSQALVASDNPQNVTTPDTGTGEVNESDPVEPSDNEPPAPETAEQSGGEDETVADVIAAQPVEPDTTTDILEGTPDGSPEQAETEQAETEQTEIEQAEIEPSEAVIEPPTETVLSVTPTPAPSPSPVLPLEPDVLLPELPEITVAPAPDEPEVATIVESEDGSNSAVTKSLRPPKERPSTAALGVLNGAQQRRAETGNTTGVIESPLSVYKRSGLDLLAYSRSATQSEARGFSGIRAAGNSSTSNYVGKVLVQLNRAPSTYTTARGRAEVAFQINPDGTVAWISVLNRKGSRDIERAAKAQVRSAAPFPRPPQGTSQRLNFVYRRNG